MTYKEAMAELKSYGTAQNRKIYARHGFGSNMFGVSFANLRKMAKKIKTDHELALKLWDSGNTDAQNLACMVADPSIMTQAQANKWAKSVTCSGLAGMASDVIAQTKFAKKMMEKMMKSPKEFICETGYSCLSSMLKRDLGVTDAETRKYLKAIEKNIHKSPNWTRYGMNWTLIAIGTYKPNLTKEAIAAAGRIGKVEVDHGETSCKTPDAASYIKKAAAHQASKRKKK